MSVVFTVNQSLFTHNGSLSASIISQYHCIIVLPTLLVLAFIFTDGEYSVFLLGILKMGSSPEFL